MPVAAVFSAMRSRRSGSSGESPGRRVLAIGASDIQWIGVGVRRVELLAEQRQGPVGLLGVLVEVDEAREDGVLVRETGVGALEGLDGNLPGQVVARGVLVEEVGVVELRLQLPGVGVGEVPQGAGGGGHILETELRDRGLVGDRERIGVGREGGLEMLPGGLEVAVLLGVDALGVFRQVPDRLRVAR